MKKIKTVAAINDISGYSRCSLTVAIPILSTMGFHCSPLPTTVLSNHTGYESFFFKDCTKNMISYINEWKKLNLQFDLIYTGFLASQNQISIISDFINHFRTAKTLVVVDPVMADEGRLYSTYTAKMCEEMKLLVSHADFVTPNITEASFLSGEKYVGENIELDLAFKMCRKIADLGCKNVIITGIRRNDKIINYVYEKKSNNYQTISTNAVDVYYTGTGDVFASVLCGKLLNGSSIKEATSFASKFVEKSVKTSQDYGVLPIEGIAIEQTLHLLNNNM